MSTLISSAVGSKKVAAPKSAARRRPAPPPPPPPPPATLPTAPTPSVANAATPTSIPSAQPTAVPPSPPPTQPSLPSTQPPSSQPIAGDATSQPQTPSTIEAVSAHAENLPVHTSTSSTSRDPPAAVVAAGEDGTLPTPDAQPAQSQKRRRGPDTAQESAQPAKRVKRSSARSNAGVQAAVQEGATPAEGGGRSTRSKAKNAATTAPVAATDVPSSARKSQSKRASKRRSSAAEGDAADEQEDSRRDAEQTPAQQAASKKKVRRRKKAAPAQADATAEGDAQRQESQAGGHEEDEDSDPELHEIDPNTVTMWEVGGNKRHGKTSEREKKMAEIDWTEVARKRREAADLVMAGNTAAAPAVAAPVPSDDAVVETTEGPAGTAESRNAQASQTLGAGANSNIGGVQFQIVNGQIVEDESSLTIDRQAQAEAEAAQSSGAPIEEEDDLTQRVNRSTHLNDRRRDARDRVAVGRGRGDWDDTETDRFYDALRMFGTDFFIISKMFAPKTRRQIKAKFVREERLDPARVTAALIGTHSTPMNLEHYAREVGRDVSEYTKYESVKQAEEVIRLSLADKEEELRNTIREEERLEEARKKEQHERESARKKGLKKAKAGAAAGGRKKKKALEGEATMGGGGPIPDAVVGADS